MSGNILGSRRNCLDAILCSRGLYPTLTQYKSKGSNKSGMVFTRALATRPSPRTFWDSSVCLECYFRQLHPRRRPSATASGSHTIGNNLRSRSFQSSPATRVPYHLQRGKTVSAVFRESPAREHRSKRSVTTSSKV